MFFHPCGHFSDSICQGCCGVRFEETSGFFVGGIGVYDLIVWLQIPFIMRVFQHPVKPAAFYSRITRSFQSDRRLLFKELIFSNGLLCVKSRQLRPGIFGERVLAGNLPVFSVMRKIDHSPW
jgi:hypothetical protein